jgi:hypothetical protein
MEGEAKDRRKEERKSVRRLWRVERVCEAITGLSYSNKNGVPFFWTIYARRWSMWAFGKQDLNT